MAISPKAEVHTNHNEAQNVASRRRGDAYRRRQNLDAKTKTAWRQADGWLNRLPPNLFEFQRFFLGFLGGSECSNVSRLCRLALQLLQHQKINHHLLVPLGPGTVR